MRLVVIGAGPSGLYFALLAKRKFPDADVEVHEQNPKDATYGFGIVLAENGLERMRKADPDSFQAIMNACFVSRHRIIAHPNETIFIEGGGYGGAIPRLRLLDILGSACERAGVKLIYGARVDDLGAFEGADLVVGADGVNSLVRKLNEEHFGTTSWMLSNRLAWYGCESYFPNPLLSFKTFEGGHFVAAAYSYSERMSTFVAECDADTWFSLGMDKMNDDERRQLAERVFAEELKGFPLIGNKSMWRQLAVVRNREWSVGRCVLIGDALHSAHPTIGSGTRIAMEDSIALVEALVDSPNDIPAALVLFRRRREPTKTKLVSAAEKSFAWYESFACKMQTYDAVPFVFDFLMRTGRIDESRLRAEYPEFMARFASRRQDNGQDAVKVTSGQAAVSMGVER